MDSYFKGKNNSSPDWQAKESALARHYRGYGWSHFRRMVMAEHNLSCDRCGVTLLALWRVGKTLDVHHKVKLRVARELRFEKSNCMVLCTPCHRIEESLTPAVSSADASTGP